jgi:hypothetical protein
MVSTFIFMVWLKLVSKTAWTIENLILGFVAFPVLLGIISAVFQFAMFAVLGAIDQFAGGILSGQAQISGIRAPDTMAVPAEQASDPDAPASGREGNNNTTSSFSSKSSADDCG